MVIVSFSAAKADVDVARLIAIRMYAVVFFIVLVRFSGLLFPLHFHLYVILFFSEIPLSYLY